MYNTVADIIDLVQSKLTDYTTHEENSPDRFTILRRLRLVLEHLASEEEFDFLARWIEPIIGTRVGVRAYPLPFDFGHNFVINQDGFVCMLSDGSNSAALKYKPAAEFFMQDLEAESNARPVFYTITHEQNGAKNIRLSPPPDLATYTIKGLYVPTFFDLQEEHDMPAIPGGKGYLMFALLAEFQPENPKWAFERDKCLEMIYVLAARNRQQQISPSEQHLRSSEVWHPRL